MSCVYISPSSQQYNEYLSGGNEEYYMNLIADKLEEYLKNAGICYKRNLKEMNVNDIVKDSNSGNYNIHLAIHSNASPENLKGKLEGSDIYYYKTSTNGKKFADIIADNMKEIYRLPDKVNTVPSTTLAELKRTKAPSALIEVAYHDNAEDEKWIKNNIDNIATALYNSIVEYLDGEDNNTDNYPLYGKVVTEGGKLNIRAEPTLNAEVIGQIPNGSEVTLYGLAGDFFFGNYNGTYGYIFSSYVKVL